MTIPIFYKQPQRISCTMPLAEMRVSYDSFGLIFIWCSMDFICKPLWNFIPPQRGQEFSWSKTSHLFLDSLLNDNFYY